MTLLICFAVLYAVGAAMTWFVAARYWIGRYGARDGMEQVEAGVWGLMVAVVWPIAAIGFVAGKIATP